MWTRSPLAPQRSLLCSCLGAGSSAWVAFVADDDSSEEQRAAWRCPLDGFINFFESPDGMFIGATSSRVHPPFALFLYCKFVQRSRGLGPPQRGVHVFILTALAHLACAGLGGYRYEAYLVALGIVVVAAQLMDFMRDLVARPLTKQAATAVRIAVAMLGGLLFLPLLIKGGAALYTARIRHQ